MMAATPSRLRRRSILLVTTLALAAGACGGDVVSSTQGPGVVVAPPPTSTLPATTTTTTPLPVVSVPSWAVFDVSRQQMMAANAADAPMAVGSLMKLLTAYVVNEAGDHTRVVTVPRMQIDPMESAIGLYAGEQLPRDVLVRAMLIVSANDAARALARDVGGSEDAFVAMMNDAAGRLGMTGTHAVNPVGLDAAGQHSTARDIVLLGNVLMSDPTFRTTVARTSARLHGQVFPATNDLLGVYAGADGIKTGHTTQAGYCILASATRDGRTVIVAVLGAATEPDRDASATALLDWAFAN